MWPPPDGGTMTGGLTWLGGGAGCAQAETQNNNHAATARPSCKVCRLTNATPTDEVVVQTIESRTLYLGILWAL